MVDGRRIQGELNMDAIYTSLSALNTPSGSTYTFITDVDVQLAAVPVSECFTQAIQGPVVREDWQKFETSIKAALISVNAGKGSFVNIKYQYLYSKYHQFYSNE